MYMPTKQLLADYLGSYWVFTAAWVLLPLGELTSLAG